MRILCSCENASVKTMTIQQMIEALIARGWTQQSIADAVVTTQPTIHRAAKGASVRYETGKAIERLYERAVSEVDSPAAA